ncbi:MAG: ATP-binding protein [Candidatus Aminicenantes bacterium]|nr:ATP-binding protein [Candidatus Aminicenantes bacterium]
MKPRTLGLVMRKALRTFPAVVVTGPRQSGKTTLLRALFGKTHAFVSLEDPDVRIRAKEDPVAFLDRHRPPVIIDEIQYVPELLSYIKTRIDERRKPGQWLYTGSQHFGLMQGISQSLAGRAAVLTLLPFSLAERIGRGDEALSPEGWIRSLHAPSRSRATPSLSSVLLRGNYPEIASRSAVDRQLWCASYISTFLERDVRNLAQIGDLSQFERFLRLCAVRTGQILNLSDLARDVGVSVPTAKRWLSVLEAGYQVYLLYPYYQSLGKRLVKSPKMYFNDTALASYLLGVHDGETLLNSPSFGNLFETMIVIDVLKRFLHSGEMPSLYYLRTRDGLEVDLVLELGQKLHLFEIKAAMTVWPKHADSLGRALTGFKSSVRTAGIISRASGSFPVKKGIHHYNWKDILGI